MWFYLRYQNKEYIESHFAVKTVSPDHALVLQCVLFCLQVLHTNLESSLQVEGPKHELLQQMANSIRKKKSIIKDSKSFSISESENIKKHLEVTQFNTLCQEHEFSS